MESNHRLLNVAQASSSFDYEINHSTHFSGPTGNRTRIACLQGRHPSIERQAHVVVRRAVLDGQ